MTMQSLMESAQAVLTSHFAVLLLLTGAHALIFCRKDARAKNHSKAEKTAHIGGWLYAALAAAILTGSLF